MTKSQTIAKLEALLMRVRSRSGSARAEPSTLAPASLEAVAAPPPSDRTVELVPPHAPPMRTEADIVVEVDVQSATADAVVAAEEIPLLSVPVEEISVPDALESRERLVAAEPVGVEPPFEVSASPAAEVEASDDLLADLGEVEEAPRSSRRPLAPEPEERLADLAFGSGEPQPPRHTPPPESGRLPAAPDDEFDADITGVREAVVKSSAVGIVPQVTLAELPASDAVAELVVAPPRPAASTFVALLDASIAL